MEMQNTPFFVTPYPEAPGGVDYLGLRQVNLALMDLLLPGLNNVTYRLRPYSVMTWMTWAFEREAIAVGRETATWQEYRQFQEKVEVLFGWSHQLHGAGAGLVGNGQVAPQGDGDLPLNFSAWGRNVSWMDAVNYGPSLKDENGLGLVAQARPKIFASTAAGDELAKALDNTLKTRDGYAQLKSLSSNSGNAAVADSLYAGWAKDAPTPEEAAAFRKVLFDEAAIGQLRTNQRVVQRMSDRSATIALLLSGLAAQSAPVTANDLRRFVACTPFPVGPSEAPKEPLAKMHAIWRVLQVRQAQRLAFETIFGWMEAQVLVNGVNLSSMIVDALVSEMKVLEPALVEESWVADKMAAYADVGGNNGSLLEAALSESSVDIFRFIDELQHDIWDGHDSRASKAVMLLILCAAISCELAGDERAVAYVKEGGRARVSLAYWSDYVMGNQSFSLRDFLIKVVENFLISQHFGVAASRYSQGKQRLRLTIEEGGLTSMLNSAYDTWRPAVTADRLDALLSLMADCYLVRVEPSQSGPLYGAV